MLEHMRGSHRSFGLPVLALIGVLLGTLISGAVLSASPLGGFALIFGAGAVIVAVFELTAYTRRRRRKPKGPKQHFLSVYLEERRKKTRGTAPEQDSIENEAELVESYQGGLIQ